jgi:hypothetical protein
MTQLRVADVNDESANPVFAAACSLAAECNRQGWNPLQMEGQRGWWRTVRAADGDASLIGLAVWEDPVANGWEWEIMEKDRDRHVAGGRAVTARDALDAVIDAARDTWALA